MDKYEYNLKLDQMKSLSAEEHYAAAAEIADTINWSKIKNISAMVTAGEVYEKLQRYEDSRDVLLLAYDRSPIGRTIVFRLAEVSIKMGDFDSAQQYYNEFVEVAPRDNLRYVLKYDMLKAKGADYSELIPILEELKDKEYTEEWAYELAYLYHKAGMPDKCVDACDELILWFGDGPYVERALELKMIYQPLTKVQEEKYRRFRLEKQGITPISAEEMEKAGEYVHEPVEIPEVELDVSTKFNTVNLQKEIARGMQQIINATEKEIVSDTIDNIKKIVEDIPYLTLPVEEEEELDIQTDKEIDGSLSLNFQELLSEEADGQMSLMTGEQGMVERQITGQMTIQEILDEWKKTQNAAQKALEKADQAKLESAKARALHEAEGIMERLTDVMPKLDAGMTPVEILREKYMEGVSPESIENLRKEQDAKAAQAVEDAKEAAREIGVVAEVVKVPKAEKTVEEPVAQPMEEPEAQMMEEPSVQPMEEPEAQMMEEPVVQPMEESPTQMMEEPFMQSGLPVEAVEEEQEEKTFADPSAIPAMEIEKNPGVRPGISIEAVRDMGQPQLENGKQKTGFDDTKSGDEAGNEKEAEIRKLAESQTDEDSLTVDELPAIAPIEPELPKLTFPIEAIREEEAEESEKALENGKSRSDTREMPEAETWNDLIESQNTAGTTGTGPASMSVQGSGLNNAEFIGSQTDDGRLQAAGLGNGQRESLVQADDGRLQAAGLGNGQRESLVQADSGRLQAAGLRNTQRENPVQADKGRLQAAGLGNMQSENFAQVVKERLQAAGLGNGQREGLAQADDGRLQAAGLRNPTGAAGKPSESGTVLTEKARGLPEANEPVNAQEQQKPESDQERNIAGNSDVQRVTGMTGKKKVTRVRIGPAAAAKARLEAEADALAHRLAANAAAARASMNPVSGTVARTGIEAVGEITETGVQGAKALTETSVQALRAKEKDEKPVSETTPNPTVKKSDSEDEKKATGSTGEEHRLGKPGEHTARMAADKIAAEIKTMFRPDEEKEVVPESGSDVVPDLSGVPKKDRQRTKPIPSAKELRQALRKRQKEDTLLETIVPKEMLEYYDESTPKQEERHLTEEQKATFSYFVPVSGMENQLAEALASVGAHLKRREAAFTGNLIIQGGQGCGKTVLATSMIRALQKETGHPNNKIGKIDAPTLNQKDISMLMKKVSGGCLIIEEAGGLSAKSARTLSMLMDSDSSGILVILEDTSKGIKRALSQDEDFARKFTQKISVPIFTNDDLVAFAKSYSEELGYRIDELAVLALYNRISNIQRLDQATTLTEVKEIVDEAIDREARGGIQKFFSILTAKRYDDDDKIILQEKDFE